MATAIAVPARMPWTIQDLAVEEEEDEEEEEEEEEEEQIDIGFMFL